MPIISWKFLLRLVNIESSEISNYLLHIKKAVGEINFITTVTTNNGSDD